MRAALIALTLISAAPAFAADSASPAKPGDDKDKLICRREIPIGSLIASRKRCMTKAQWDQVARDGNEEARRMVYENQGRPTGN